MKEKNENKNVLIYLGLIISILLLCCMIITILNANAYDNSMAELRKPIITDGPCYDYYQNIIQNVTCYIEYPRRSIGIWIDIYYALMMIVEIIGFCYGISLIVQGVMLINEC